MKKICTKCNRTVEGIEANGRFCSQCGTELTELPTSPAPGGVSINEDNRIDKSVHTGDNIKVGGDNAQTINKQQVSTTNITNIQQIQQDETKKIVNCAISGKAVLLIETANCPKCHRCVSQQYYIDSKRMCTDCYEKQYGHAYTPPTVPPTVSPTVRPTTPSNSYQQQAKTEGVGTLMGNGTRPTPPPPATSAPSNSSNPILYIAIAAAIGVGGYFLFSNKGSEKTDAPTKPVTEQVVSESASSTSTSETTKKQSNKQNKTISSVKQSQAAITPKVKEDSQSKRAPSYAAEPSTSTAKESVSVQPKLQTAGDYYSAAKSAYNRGNYTQAISQFQEAAAKGDAASYYYLSTMYREGNGVGKSIDTAFQYMLKAAQGGYAAAYYELAEMYRGGRGTEKNIPQARIWYQKVIDTGGKNADRAKRALDNCN
ncbi:tetratricopeptide repeat protein [Bacteroides fragilis]|uniref:tetratricopeptide repeat protein n=1 Tax=Bacteroides fragilis TaxID=817 RepID=UPI0039B4A3AD